MATRLTLGFRPSTTGDSSKPFARIKQRLPISASINRRIADEIMRRGAGSVAEQRRRQETQGPRGLAVPWKRTSAFGNQPAPARTLHRTGASDARWLGVGPGSITRVTAGKIAIGVTGYAALFQRRSAWLVKAKRMARGNRRLAMQIYLGLAKAAWISEAKLRKGLRNVPRQVAISRRMLRRTGTTIIRYLPTGKFKAAA